MRKRNALLLVGLALALALAGCAAESPDATAPQQGDPRGPYHEGPDAPEQDLPPALGGNASAQESTVSPS